MVLPNTSSSIQWRLGYAITATALDCTASYIDITTTATTENTVGSSSNNTSFVTAVSAPASSTVRNITRLNFYNADTRPAQIIVKIDNGTAYTEKIFQLDVGMSATYINGRGWSAMASNAVRGEAKQASFSQSGRRRNYITHTAGTTKSLTSNATHAVYLGTADRDFTQVVVVWRQTTVSTNPPTWAELAIATGAFVIQGNATLTRLGSAVSIAGDTISNGIKTTTVTGLSGTAGMELWLLMGCQAAAAGAIRATVADITSGGHQQVATTTRPSTMAGATAFTLETTATTGIQCDFRLLP